MLKEKLKKRALSHVNLTDDYQPIIEEYFESENGEGEALFSWINEKSDTDISVSLDLVGNLTKLSVPSSDSQLESHPVKSTEKRKLADRFLQTHYPDALTKLTFYKLKELGEKTRFYYEQIVMDLPLDDAGCTIEVDNNGNIIEFNYYGIRPVPEIPKRIISKEKLIEHVQDRLNFQLIITTVYTALHDVEEDGFRLVYEPVQLLNYKADVLKPTLTFEHEVDEIESFVSLPAPENIIAYEDLSVEEIIGIPKQMEVIRKIEMGDETGIVWRDKDWEMNEQDLSIDGFFKKQTEDTVKAFISTKTGQLRRFMWFKERGGDLQLSQEASYQKAMAFLQKVFPTYDQYLKLIIQEDEEEIDETDKIWSFAFYVHNGYGIPMHLETVLVSVNRATGQIDFYSGLGFEIEQLSTIPNKALLTNKEALDRFIQQLDFKLMWKRDYESEAYCCSLVYEACDKRTRTPIRYIDATTGEVICDKED